MADLQAVAAARNLAAEPGQRPATAIFKAELACIVDTLDGGILIYRSARRAFLVSSRALHRVKRLFERGCTCDAAVGLLRIPAAARHSAPRGARHRLRRGRRARPGMLRRS
ncbi:MAG: hypothetical protein ACYDHY_15770 [Acidiferrobacterales bacterium]